MKLTIGIKLIGLITLLLATTASCIVAFSNGLFVADNTGLIQQTNADVARGMASQVRTSLEALTEKMRILGAAFLQEYKSPSSREAILRESFAKDKDFLALFLEVHDASGRAQVKDSIVSPDMAAHGDRDGSKALATLSAEPDFSLETVARGGIQIGMAPLKDGRWVLALAIPFVKSPTASGRFSHSLLALVDDKHFTALFPESSLTTGYLVDARGRLLAHSDARLVATSLADVPIVAEMRKGEASNWQMRYEDPRTGDIMLGAYRTVGFGGLGVVAEMPEEKALEAPRRVKYRATLVAIGVLCIAIFAGWLLSDSIVLPIKQLAIAAQRVARGDFKVQLRPVTRDEVAELSVLFNRMARGLEERERLKQAFSKFHDPEIAEKLVSGQVRLGGEHLTATVLFTDIRGFTAMSERLKPEEVLEMLNEYMTRMVRIIRAHGGLVDKYVGDAIMALWGVPLGRPDDTSRAIRACLAMREELAKLNEVRRSRQQPVLHIGMGLNVGAVIAGNIGSEERMEYTVIGDTVNVAARIESLTKSHGLDLLVEASVFAKCRDQFLFEPCSSSRVKGKTGKIDIYAVTGYVDEHGTPVIVKTPYSRYPPEQGEMDPPGVASEAKPS